MSKVGLWEESASVPLLLFVSICGLEEVILFRLYHLVLCALAISIQLQSLMDGMSTYRRRGDLFGCFSSSAGWGASGELVFLLVRVFHSVEGLLDAVSPADVVTNLLSGRR